MCESGEPPISKAKECRTFHERKLGRRAQDALGYGVPLFISEFGACLDSESCVQEINAVCDNADQYLAGWAYWQFKTYKDLTTSAGDKSEGFYNKDGQLQTGKVKALTRTYLQATQGIPVYMKFNVADALFHAIFVLDTAIQAPTLVYWNQEYWYPNGFTHSLVSGSQTVLTEKVDYELDLATLGYAKIKILNSALNGETLNFEMRPKTAQIDL